MNLKEKIQNSDFMMNTVLKKENRTKVVIAITIPLYLIYLLLSLTIFKEPEVYADIRVIEEAVNSIAHNLM